MTTATKRILVMRAMQKHPKIEPCAGKPSFVDMFTEPAGRYIFWYNDPVTKSTHVETMPIRRK